jgi:NAD-dependent SIR2 family protein deacetylase
METRAGFEVTSLFSLFTGMNYFTCEVCGNEYDKVFEVHMDGKVHVFDSFECAIQALAPTCANCGSRIIGHGMEAGGVFYCSAHCARQYGLRELEDRVLPEKEEDSA